MKILSGSRSKKREFLRDAGAWNERARHVEAPLFARSDFFDPVDKVQVKYEMLRAHQVDGESVTKASQQFGFSRESFYKIMDAFHERGMAGLADQKRGPKQGHKLTREAQTFLLEELGREPSVGTVELVERLLSEMGISIHRRSVERFRRTHKKKPWTGSE